MYLKNNNTDRKQATFMQRITYRSTNNSKWSQKFYLVIALINTASGIFLPLGQIPPCYPMLKIYKKKLNCTYSCKVIFHINMLLPIYRKKDLEFNSQLDFLGRKFEVKSLLARELARQVFVGVASKYRDSDT